MNSSHKSTKRSVEKEEGGGGGGGTQSHSRTFFPFPPLPSLNGLVCPQKERGGKQGSHIGKDKGFFQNKPDIKF